MADRPATPAPTPPTGIPREGDELWRGTGTVARLGPEFARGGEGVIHAVRDDPAAAAKIYLAGLASSRRAKVEAMVEAGIAATTPDVAFPAQALDAPGGTFVGFTMRKVSGRQPVHALYAASSRKHSFPRATYPMLVRAALNVARTMARVHAAGCVVGDVNHSGILVGQDARVSFIDADSFQFTHAGTLHRCRVGVPEFTPPELQGADLEDAVRTADGDAFGLAVLVFYLLMMGRHPFNGRWSGQGEMPTEKAIVAHAFAYSRERATGMTPPPAVPTLDDLPGPVAEAFERAFGPPTPLGRPDASEWAALLEAAEGRLVRCAENAEHHRFAEAPACPWCRMERAYPGFAAFPNPDAPSATPGVDVEAMIRAAMRIEDPGEVRPLVDQMPVVNAVRSEASRGRARRTARIARVRAWSGTMGISGFVEATMAAHGYGQAGIALGMAGVATWAVAKAMTGRDDVDARALATAEREFRDLCEDWDRNTGNDAFLEERKTLMEAADLLRGLPRREREALRAIDVSTRTSQLRRHLERFRVADAGVPGIGASLKGMLASYGIDTAADVTTASLSAVPGFGPARIAAMVEWRTRREAGFSFDPDLKADPAERARVQREWRARSLAATARVRNSTDRLAKLREAIKGGRVMRYHAAMPVWERLCQARADASR